MKLVVVMGMHRSGTSAITRGLQVMGVSLGTRLMPAAEGDNPTGFWEDLDIYDLNNEMLTFLLSDWQGLAPVEAHQVEELRKNGFFLRAVELIRAKVAEDRPFGLKDPRIARLAPFWAEVFAHCELDVAFVLAVRNPVSVARSLLQRNGLDPGTSYALWLTHVVASLRATATAARIVVDYDLLMEDPDHELHRIATALGLVVDRQKLDEYRCAFLTNFDEAEPNGIFTPFSAGCGTIVQYPYLEKDSTRPRGVLGMFDVSARPFVPKETLTLALPMNKFQKMIENMQESFLTTLSWDKVRARMEKS